MTKDYPKVLYCFPEEAGEVFMPSNGTEGEIFQDAFCNRCIHEKFCHTQKHGDLQCDIMDRSFLYWYEPGHPNYPKEWRYSDEGWPVCLAWVKWDWNRDDDGNWNDPPEPEPYDPNQLCLPFELNAIENGSIAKEATVAIHELIPHPQSKHPNQ